VLERLKSKGIIAIDDNELEADEENKTIKYKDGSKTFSLAGILGSVSEEPKELLADIVQIGNYVEYNYTPEEYTTPSTEEERVYSSTETFNSGTGGNAEITKWRVLSNEDGVIRLISEVPTTGTITLERRKWIFKWPNSIRCNV